MSKVPISFSLEEDPKALLKEIEELRHENLYLRRRANEAEFAFDKVARLVGLDAEVEDLTLQCAKRVTCSLDIAESMIYRGNAAIRDVLEVALPTICYRLSEKVMNRLFEQTKHGVDMRIPIPSGAWPLGLNGRKRMP